MKRPVVRAILLAAVLLTGAIPSGHAEEMAPDFDKMSVNDFNNIPYTKLRSMSGDDLMKAADIAKKKGVFLMLNQPGKGTKKTIRGELVDNFCYAAGQMKGQGHGMCARACILKGASVGLVTAEGKWYQVLPKLGANPVPDEVLDNIAHRVELTGLVNTHHSVPTIQAISVKRI